MTSFGLLPPDLPRSIGSRGCFVVLHGTGIVPIVDRITARGDLDIFKRRNGI